MKRFTVLTWVAAVMLVMLSFPPLVVHADTDATANSGLLSRLYVSTNGNIYVRLRDRPTNAEDCGAGQYYIIGASEPSKNQLYAALLTAWDDREIVKLRVPDNHVAGTNCPILYVVIDK